MSKTFDELADPGKSRFANLDQKLMYMLTTLIEDNCPALHSGIRIKDQEMFQKKKLLGGRQMLWLIRNHFKTHPSMSVAHSITDLTNHPWLGDDRIAEFIYKWDFLVTSVDA